MKYIWATWILVILSVGLLCWDYFKSPSSSKKTVNSDDAYMKSDQYVVDKRKELDESIKKAQREAKYRNNDHIVTKFYLEKENERLTKKYKGIKLVDVKSKDGKKSFTGPISTWTPTYIQLGTIMTKTKSGVRFTTKRFHFKDMSDEDKIRFGFDQKLFDMQVILISNGMTNCSAK
jgi:hypothetical protein